MADKQVRVVVRVKPDTEKSNCESIFSFINEQSCSVNGSEFTFDRIFPPRTSQKELFVEHFNEDVDNVLQGFNSTIIAFGQTAAGKSYTMTGGAHASEGIIPRAVRRIFENDCHFLTASYVEIHNEKIRDLFNTLSPVSILGDGTLKDAKLLRAESPQQVNKLVAEGNRLRSVANTNMNNASSRSHAVLSLKLENGAKLVLVDLAGSEVVKKTGASGQTLGEAGCINKSLTSLAMVISALTQPNASKVHIPYRSSKLTQILQDALGGDCKTSLIVNCSSSPTHLAETISSLRFGSRSKLIKNKFPTREERNRDNALRQWKADLDKELLAWKLSARPPPHKWLDLSRVYALLGESCPSDCLNAKPVEFDCASQTVQQELNSHEEIRKIESEIEGHIAKVAQLKVQLEQVCLQAEEPGLEATDYVVEQQKQLEQCNQELAELTESNDALQKQLAESRSRPLAEKIQLHLRKLDTQIVEYARLLVLRSKKRKSELNVCSDKRLRV